ncbi:MAG: cache domain-containing protein [Syntrophaceae bacterium]|nr:cache domain-containing protein [Syntrophaceae bacterium]
MKKIFLLLLGAVLFFCGAASAAFAATNPPPLLGEAAQNLSAELNRLDDGLGRAAKKLGKAGLTGPEAREALSALCSKFSYAVDCAAVDLQGTMVTLEPAPFRRFEGKNIAGQEQVKRILKTGQPVLSGVFRAVEGFPAIDAEYPVAKPDGKRLGSVSLLFKPEKLLGGVLDGLFAGTPVNIWVMDKQGMILYDVDKSQIGLNLFSDPLYRPYDSLLKLGR